MKDKVNQGEVEMSNEMFKNWESLNRWYSKAVMQEWLQFKKSMKNSIILKQEDVVETHMIIMGELQEKYDKNAASIRNAFLRSQE